MWGGLPVAAPPVLLFFDRDRQLHTVERRTPLGYLSLGFSGRCSHPYTGRFHYGRGGFAALDSF